MSEEVQGKETHLHSSFMPTPMHITTNSSFVLWSTITMWSWRT
jgi:hypothetical protein